MVSASPLDLQGKRGLPNDCLLRERRERRAEGRERPRSSHACGANWKRRGMLLLLGAA